MQVAMVPNFTYMKSKNSPRMATLTYSHFGNPGRSLHEAPYNIVHKKSRLELFSDLPAGSRGGFFVFIYVN